MLDDRLDAYFDKFGTNYPLLVTDTRTESEIIAYIDRCIETDTKAEPPKLRSDGTY